MKKTIAVIAAGIVLGYLGARHLFVGSWLIVVPWSVAGLIVGWWGTRNESIVNGVVYGFVVSFTFLVAGYSGPFSLASRIPFFVVLSVFGGMGGTLLGLLAFVGKTKLRGMKKGKSPQQ